MRGMPVRYAAAILSLVALIALSLRLVVAADDLTEAAGVLAAIGVVVPGLAGFVGLALRGARWSAVTLALGLGAASALVATTPTTAASIGSWGVATCALGMLALAAPQLTVPTTGPPAVAVMLSLALLFVPLALGGSDPAGPSPAHWVAAAVAVASAWLYTQAWWVGLWSVRLAVPAALAVAAALSPWPGAILLIAVAVAVTVAAWTRGARLAVIEIAPLRSPAYPIPPELAPDDVLQAAGIDRSGRKVRDA